jgi:hypothetical protein
VAHARTLPEIAPEEDLWPGIAARVAAFARTEDTPRLKRAAFVRGITLSWPQLVAAGLTLVALSGGAAWFMGRGGRAAQTAAREATRGDVVTVSHVDPQYAAEVEDLQKVLDERRSQLDPETVKTIEANLKIIDLATMQARQALAADPANPYLKDYLSKTMKRKVELLKQATVYATAQ